uniref:hypothetical protein n=4 Tax=Enterobacterales TaxID=91347 RepID=UPI002263ADF5
WLFCIFILFTMSVLDCQIKIEKFFDTLYYIISFKQRLVIAINNHIAETGFRTVNVRLFKKSGLHKNATASISNYATHTCANTNFKRLILIALLIFSYS